MKFTKEGEIEVSVKLIGSATTDGKYNFLFSIRDTGIGITKENQRKIFEQFSQANSSISRKFGGTGIDLTIASKLLLSMGSMLKVESELGHGSTFSFILSNTWTEEED